MGSSRLFSRRRQDLGSKWARIVMAILATVGLIDTGSITLHRWGWLGTLSCPGGSDGCDKVLNSAWGTVPLGDALLLPLSFFGAIAYFAVLGMAIIPFLPGIAERKLEITRRTWWGMFLSSCCMAVFSLLLIGLMVFRIDAFCFFCVLSACISIALLIVSVIGGGWDDLGQLFFRGFLLSLGTLLAGFIWVSAVDPKSPDDFQVGKGVPPVVESISTSYEINLAQHLSKQGVVMYSAYWCPHCHDQKEMFGKQATSQLRVIECAEDGQNSQRALCLSKEIEGFPTWEINGELFSGVKSLERLADLSGYNGKRRF